MISHTAIAELRRDARAGVAPFRWLPNSLQFQTNPAKVFNVVIANNCNQIDFRYLASIQMICAKRGLLGWGATNEKVYRWNTGGLLRHCAGVAGRSGRCRPVRADGVGGGFDAGAD